MFCIFDERVLKWIQILPSDPLSFFAPSWKISPANTRENFDTCEHLSPSNILHSLRIKLHPKKPVLLWKCGRGRGTQSYTPIYIRNATHTYFVLFEPLIFWISLGLKISIPFLKRPTCPERAELDPEATFFFLSLVETQTRHSTSTTEIQ